MVSGASFERHSVRVPLSPDLFGDLVVECWYGSLHSRRGQYRCHAVPDRAAAAKLVGEIGRVRRRHGYLALSSACTHS